MEFMVKVDTLKDGLIMYCTERKDGYGDFASIAIKDGFVEFRFDTGSGPAILKSPEKLTLGKWHNVFVTRRMKEGILKVDNGTRITGRSLGRTRGLNIRSPIFIGGFNSKLKGHKETSTCRPLIWGGMCLFHVCKNNDLKFCGGHRRTPTKNFW